jgi:hypothetical protein
MRFFVVDNEFEVVEIGPIKSCVGEILLAEFLERLFVEDVLEMFELEGSALLRP